MKRSVAALVFALVALAQISAAGKREAGLIIDVGELRNMMQQGDVIILDIRDPDSYSRGHIPGAVLVPPNSVEAVASDLAARGARIVTYCNCPAEELSLAAAFALRDAGVRRVHVLKGGYEQWVREGQPVITGSRPFQPMGG